MISYELIEPVRIMHNGKVYVQGDILTLSQEEAAKLGVYIKRLEKSGRIKAPEIVNSVANADVTEEFKTVTTKTTTRSTAKKSTGATE